MLGSGQDGGSPQFGSPAGVGRPRTASSIAVIGSDGLVLLFDATPDIRVQSLQLPTRKTSEGPVDAVFITHAHMGHYAGLLHFGKEAAATSSVPLFAPDSVIAYLESNQPWATLFSDAHLGAHDPAQERAHRLAVLGLTHPRPLDASAPSFAVLRSQIQLRAVARSPERMISSRWP